MRKLTYLSPTSIASFKKDTKRFYSEYLSDNKMERMPQTKPMAVGSALDAYLKSKLVTDLFGNTGGGKFEFETLFEAQVAKHCRDVARIDGGACLEAYIETGAYGELLLEMTKSKQAPRFEFELKGAVTNAGIGGVPILGRPDAWFIDSAGNDVILDFKVNGFYGKKKTSPEAKYVICRELNGKRYAHPDARPSKGPGLIYNTSGGLEDANEGWAGQLACYGWMSGNAVGDKFLCAIDQFCGPGPSADSVGDLRIASHRAFVGAEFQKNYHREAVGIWGIIQSGWIFRDMTEDASRELQERLDRGAVSEKDAWFGAAVKEGSW